jgi:hypothetical protein
VCQDALTGSEEFEARSAAVHRRSGARLRLVVGGSCFWEPAVAKVVEAAPPPLPSRADEPLSNPRRDGLRGCPSSQRCEPGTHPRGQECPRPFLHRAPPTNRERRYTQASRRWSGPSRRLTPAEGATPPPREAHAKAWTTNPPRRHHCGQECPHSRLIRSRGARAARPAGRGRRLGTAALQWRLQLMVSLLFPRSR